MTEDEMLDQLHRWIIKYSRTGTREQYDRDFAASNPELAAALRDKTLSPKAMEACGVLFSLGEARGSGERQKIRHRRDKRDRKIDP